MSLILQRSAQMIWACPPAASTARYAFSNFRGLDKQESLRLPPGVDQNERSSDALARISDNRRTPSRRK